jgi:hypothetical protein
MNAIRLLQRIQLNNPFPNSNPDSNPNEPQVVSIVKKHQEHSSHPI